MTLPIRNVRLQVSHGGLFWREVGFGPPLVFLHGTWQDSGQWEPLLRSLGDRYHCLALDLLGFGESTQPRPPYSIELELEALTEWLEALHLPPVVVVAEGLGAWVATSLALRSPERVRGLVLMAPEGVALGPKRWALERSLVGWFPWRAWGLLAIAPLARLLKWSGIIQQLAWRRQLRHAPVACTLLFRRKPRAIHAERLDDQLGWLKPPLLLLQGEQANPTTLALNRLYGAAPLAELRLVPGGDNLVQTQPEAIAAQIQSWLRALDSQP